jgi:hypothetical protein
LAGTLSFGGSAPDEYLTCCAVAGLTLAARMPVPAIAEIPHNTPRRFHLVGSIVSSSYSSLTTPDSGWV